MSLKDRLKTVANKQTTIVEEIKQEPKYYESSDIANQIDSLGVIDNLFADDDLNAIYVSGAKNIYIERKGKIHKSTTTYRDNVQLENLIKRYAQNIGVEINEQKPYIKFNHKEGINVSATLPPLSNVATMFIKCYKDKFATLQILQEEQSITKEIALVLETLGAIKCNILIAGEKNTLKTTLLSAMGKKIPTNYRGILIDNQEEFKILNSNYTNFNLSNFEDKNTQIEILNSIINSNPDKLLVNDCCENLLLYLTQKASCGFKGLMTTLCASNPLNAMEKLTHNILEQKPFINSELAKEMAYKAFDIIIFTTRDEIGRRKISSISQVNINSDGECILLDIFKINHLGEFQSTGFVPEFFEEAKLNSLPISQSIFDAQYKHTYQQNYKTDALQQFAKRSANIDILRKFKKELPTQEIKEEETDISEEIENNENNSAELEQNQVVLNEQEILEKVQEKFDEFKLEIQNLETEPLQENLNDIQQTEENNENLY